MSASTKLSRCGFAVIKLHIGEEDFFLMRKNVKWKDVSFIGGHDNPRDAGSLLRAARRELLEEVPALRSFKTIELQPLTEEVGHGPVFSPSANVEVKYILRFFLVRFGSDPTPFLKGLGSRTPNILTRQDELLTGCSFKVAELVHVLNRSVAGGLSAVPYSWDSDLHLDGVGSPLSQHRLSWG